MTLCFLAYHPEKLIPRIAETIASVPPRPVGLRFESEPTPRPKGRPRLYAVGAQSDGAVVPQAEPPRRSRPSALRAGEARVLAPRDGRQGALGAAAAWARRAAGEGAAEAVAEPPAPLPEVLTEPF